jgi:hypothetical protein
MLTPQWMPQHSQPISTLHPQPVIPPPTVLTLPTPVPMLTAPTSVLSVKREIKGGSNVRPDSKTKVSHLLETSDDNKPIALRKPYQEIKLTSKMKNSLDYLGCATANIVLVENAINDNVTMPKNYQEAMAQPDLWFQLMVKKLTVMREKEVYCLVPCPLGKNVMKSRWVFVNKYDDAGNIVACKARLVTKGFTQVLGEDYDEMYAFVAHLESMCLVCAIAALAGLCLWQVDFVSTFLNSQNVFKVYMEQLPGFEEGGDGDYVWLLLKTLYGMMQGVHDWAQNLEHTYQGLGYDTSKADPQI